MLAAVLNCQYAVSESINCALKVKQGSGMGKICAGEVSDISFYAMAERRFALLASTRREFSLEAYWRFKDDGFLVFGDIPRSKIDEFFSRLQVFSREFIIEVERVSRVSVPMLDLEISKASGLHNSRLSYSLFTKPTSVWKPLSVLSSHPASVHCSWPLSQVRRINQRFSSTKDAEIAVTSFKRDWSRASSIRFDAISDPGQGRSARPPENLLSAWLVFPFRQAWANAKLHKALLNACIDMPPLLRRFQPRLCWRLGGPPLTQVIRRDAAVKQKKIQGG